MFRRLGFAALLVAALALGVSYAPANAISGSGSFTITCSAVVDNGSSFTADRDNTGLNTEAYSITVVDGLGNVLFSFSDSRSVGFTGSLGTIFYASAPQANPITLTFISLAGNGFQEQLVLRLSGECVGLPVAGACNLAVPANAVVGEAPLGAFIFSAPGQATGLKLKPGTYIVVGQDESQTYYKIVLACQFVWVRKDTMQPSFQPPQNGAPLPTTIVK